MITATLEPSLESLLARLSAKAGILAEARAERDALAKLGNPARWRRATLIWPIFAKG